MPLIWHGDKVAKAVRVDARKRVRKAALLFVRTVKMSMQRGGRTEHGGAKQKGEKYARTGTYVSQPGEVPRVQTGTLRRSIMFEMHPFLPIAKAGPDTTAPYGKWLELGTSRMPHPRPFLRPALRKLRIAFAELFGR